MYGPENALKPLKKQFRRDFSFTQHFGATEPINLPDSFPRANAYEIKDQKKTQFCTAFATTEAAERHEGVILDPLYSVKGINVLQGLTIPFQGADIRTAMMAGVKFGFLEKKDAPYSLDTTSELFIADPKNWDAKYDLLAKPHAQGAFFSVDGNNDVYENFRSAIFTYNQQADNKNNNIVFGMKFRQAWYNCPGGVIPDVYDPNGLFTMHALDFIDWVKLNEKQYGRLQNSSGSLGPWAGDNGYLYISRETLNREVDQRVYGAFMYDKNANPDQIKKLQWNVIELLIDIVVHLWKKLTK